MKLRRAYRYHGLLRPRVRQSWNKYNLYNLLQNTYMPTFTPRTFFQQKWTAKALLRGYHGEHIKEGKWERMFSRRINSVVNMNPQYMALHDGSEQAAGRGSGLKKDPARKLSPEEKYGPAAGNNLASNAKTPYMQMTFAPMERRLDIALFRAMFASSARQARQFVVHGRVTVNGKKMVYPGYQLNPGDLFQVDMDHVLYATGMSKNTRRNGVKPAEGVTDAERTESAAQKARSSLPELAARAKKLLSGDLHGTVSTKHKRHLRAFMRDASKAIAALRAEQAAAVPAAEGEAAAAEAPEAEDADAEDTDAPKSDVVASVQYQSVVTQLSDMLSALNVADVTAQDAEAQDAEAGAAESSEPKASADSELSKIELERFNELLQKDLENPYDPSKPYRTPWRPRPYMENFAHIPRYLEVNHNICAAVYLRHPVARPGHSEVASPYPEPIHQLAFNWYLRRR